MQQNDNQSVSGIDLKVNIGMQCHLDGVTSYIQSFKSFNVWSDRAKFVIQSTFGTLIFFLYKVSAYSSGPHNSIVNIIILKY